MRSRIPVVFGVVPMLVLLASATQALAQAANSNVVCGWMCMDTDTLAMRYDAIAPQQDDSRYLRGPAVVARGTSGPLGQPPMPYLSSRAAGGKKPSTRFFHGDHGAVSPALIDPTFTHHAILEDELRVNYFRFNRRASDARSVATLEIAYAFSDALGAEIFIPYVLDAIEVAGSSRQLLDIEVQPLKWSFLRRYNLVMTAVGAVVVPVEQDGDGERVWRFEPHLFVDAAVGPLAIQTNFIASFADNGEREIELATSIARMVYFTPVNSAGPLLELLWEIPVAGEDGARSEPFLAPGLKVQVAGWYFGGSYLFPLRPGSTEPTQFALTAGYHVSFTRP